MNRLFNKTLAIAFALMVPFVSMAGTKEFRVDGIKVIHRQTPKDVISVRLFVEGGTGNYSKAQEGVESVALQLVMNGGTTELDKVAFASASERIGTTFGSNTTYDYGNVSMTCVKAFWDESWDLFSAALMNPGMPESEFDIIKQQSIANAKNNSSDPDSHLRNIAMVNAFGQSNYGKIPGGSPESLEGLTLSQVKSHWSKIFGKKNVFLVVVGNVDEKDLKAKISKALGNMPAGSLPKYEDRILITEDGHYVEDRDIATNYIRGLMSAPRMDHPDGVPMMVAMSILGDRYFEELRTKRSLSYAPAAFYSRGVLNNPYNAIYISTLDPKQSMEVMVAEINKIKEVGFEDKELADKKQGYLTQYYMGLETTSAQSNGLGLAEMAGGWELADEFTEKVNKLTTADINRVFDQYTKAIKWTYLGKQDMVDADDFKKPKERPAGKNKPY